MRPTIRHPRLILTAGIIVAALGIATWFLIPQLNALSPASGNHWQGEAIPPEQVSWQNVTLDHPGRALVQGSRRPENGICSFTSIPMSLNHDRPHNIGGLWTTVIWTDEAKCVHLIEYGYASRAEVEEFKRHSPAPMNTSPAKPAN